MAGWVDWWRRAMGWVSSAPASSEVDYSVTADTEAIARRLHTEARATQGRTEAIARRLNTEARQ